MPKLPTTIATAAAFCALPLLSAAQTSPSSAMPGPGNPQSPPPAGAAKTGAATGATTGTPTGANTGAAANTSATAPSLSAGMTVKDNTGATIGQIVKLGAGANGASMATIKMGTDTFQAPAANLAAQDGAATINLTQAQIAAQLHPK